MRVYGIQKADHFVMQTELSDKQRNVPVQGLLPGLITDALSKIEGILKEEDESNGHDAESWKRRLDAIGISWMYSKGKSHIVIVTTLAEFLPAYKNASELVSQIFSKYNVTNTGKYSYKRLKKMIQAITVGINENNKGGDREASLEGIFKVRRTNRYWKGYEIQFREEVTEVKHKVTSSRNCISYPFQYLFVRRTLNMPSKLASLSPPLLFSLIPTVIA
jgi:hypothetical protein